MALTLVTPTEKGYAEVISGAKSRVKLDDHGITDVFMKQAMTGGFLLEIAGPDRAMKAESLAAPLRPALADKDVKIHLPAKTTEILIVDLDDSVTPGKVVEAIAREGG